MNGVPVAPRRVFGVSLAAGEGAGDRTWVCRAHPGSEGIRVESVESISRLPGGAVDPHDVCRSLVVKVLEAPRSAWGFDFAFGLPADTLPDAGGISPGRDRWQANLEFISATPDVDDGAAERRTDRERGLGPPLSEGRRGATRLGMSGILKPLHGKPEIVVLPVDPLPRAVEGMPPAMVARVASTYLLEVGPEPLLVSLEGDEVDADPGADRMRRLRAMISRGWIRPMARALRERAVSEPAALRAVAAAVAAWRGYREYDHGALAGEPAYGAEGHVYC